MFDSAAHYLTGDWIDAWAAAVIAALALIVLPLAASEAFSGRMRISERAPAVVCLLGAALMLAGLAWLAYGSHAINIRDGSVSGSFELSQWPLLGGLLLYIVGIAIGVARREPGTAANRFYGFGFLGAIHSVLLVNLTAPWGGILWQFSNGPWKTFAGWGDGGEELGREFWPNFAPIGEAAYRFGDVRYPEPQFLMGNVVGALPFIVIGVAVLSGYMYLRRREGVPGAVMAVGAAIPLVVAVSVGLWLDQGWSPNTGAMFGVGISLLAPLALVSASRRRGLGRALGRSLSPPSPATELSQTGENWPARKEQRMNDFLTFRRMITPVIIQILYWMMTLAAIVAGIVLLSREEGDAKAVGLAVIVIGPLVLRVYAELLMVVFRIYETLTDIRNQGVRGGLAQSAPTPGHREPGPSVPRAEGRTTPEPERRTKNCPYCAESIPYEETKCRFCDSEVPNEPDSPQ